MSTIHQGQNIQRLRESLKMNTGTLAAKLGDDWDEKKISLLEQKETIEPALLNQVAKALEIPVEAIQNLTGEGNVNIISNNTFEHIENAQPNFQSSINHQELHTLPSSPIKEILEEILKTEHERTKMLIGLIQKMNEK